MVTFSLNGERREVDVPDAHPLLWVLREHFALTGTKFGCGIGQCGACTVHLNGQPVRSCQTPVAAAQGAEVTTIEGVTAEGGSPVQQAWIAEQVPQCGYCQSGQIMSAIALLAARPTPTDEEIDQFMSGNICRCGAYNAIRRAIHHAAEMEAGRVMTDDASAGGGVDR
ncbi:MAG: (2Fe-2S)-binding protein [Longimicrobiales bacterium]|nr:(2Fe-2S)-binding protein [Longimicrobiales bacterium]